MHVAGLILNRLVDDDMDETHDRRTLCELFHGGFGIVILFILFFFSFLFILIRLLSLLSPLALPPF